MVAAIELATQDTGTIAKAQAGHSTNANSNTFQITLV